MTDYITPIEEALAKGPTPGPWAVCGNPPPNLYWSPGQTIGAADPGDARRVCDERPAR